MSTVIDPEDLMQKAQISIDKGDTNSGISCYRLAASAYADQGNYQLAGFALSTLALRLSPDHDSLDDALAAYEGAAQEFLRADQPRQSADALFSAGVLAMTGKRLGPATKVLLDVAEKYDRLSNSDSSMDAHNEILELRALAGEARRCVSDIAAGLDTRIGGVRP